MMQRLEIRPVASRRLRAALLLVLLLSGFSLSQSSLSGWPLYGVSAALATVFIHAWVASGRQVPVLALYFRPLLAAVVLPGGLEQPLRCTRLSVYPWLIVLHTESQLPHGELKRQIVVLLPDSLPDQHPDDWRQLLVWAKLMRQQIAFAA